MNMMQEIENNQKITISDIRHRLQFLITIGVFFSGFMYYFSKMAKQQDAEKHFLFFAAFIIAYIIVYLLFEMVLLFLL